MPILRNNTTNCRRGSPPGKPAPSAARSVQRCRFRYCSGPLRVVNGCTHLGRVPWGPVVTLWQTRHVGLPPPRDHRNGISVRATPIAQDQESPRLSRPTEPRSPNRHEPPGRQQSSTVPERGIGASALAYRPPHWPVSHATAGRTRRTLMHAPCGATLPQIPAGLPVTPCPGLRRSAREATAGASPIRGLDGCLLRAELSAPEAARPGAATRSAPVQLRQQLHADSRPPLP